MSAMRMEYAVESSRRVSVEYLTQGAPILVLSPHPDDESLGCGALLAAAWRSAGAHVVCVTDGAASHRKSRLWSHRALAALRAGELSAAARALGGSSENITWLNAPDGALPFEGPYLTLLAHRVAEICRSLGCRSLFTTAVTDAHADHKATAELAARVVALCPGTRLFHYPVWTRWDQPSHPLAGPHQTLHALETSPWRHQKRRAIEAHRSQRGLVIRDDPGGFVLPESMVNLFVTTDELFVGSRS